MATNREIVFVLRVQNEARAAIAQIKRDLAGLNTRPAGGGSSGGSGGGSGGGGSGGQRIPGRAPIDANSEALDRMGAMARGAGLGWLDLARNMAGWLTVGAATTLTLRGIVQAGDAANMAIARINASTGQGVQSAAAIYDTLQRGAQQTGTSTAAAVDAFLRFNLAGQAIGKTSEEVVRFSQTLQRMGVISGNSTQQLNAAFMQLGQGLASGRLQGEELRSVLENFPQLAVLIAQSMGKSIGDLRKLAEEGKITPDVIFAAVRTAQESVNAQFRDMPNTVQRATASAGEAFSALARRIDEAAGLSTRIANALQAVADRVQRAADNMVPETAIARFRRMQEELRQLERAAEAAAERQAGVWLENNNRRGLNRGLQQTAMSNSGGEAAARQAIIDATKQELAVAREAAVEEENRIVRLRSYREAAAQAQRQDEERRRVTEQVREAMEGLGIGNDKARQQIEALRTVVAAGADAFSRYGLTVDQAGAAIAQLEAKINPVLGVIRALNEELEQAQAENAGEFAAAVSRDAQRATANGVRALPESGPGSAEDLRNRRQAVALSREERRERELARGEALRNAQAADRRAGRGVRTEENRVRLGQAMEDYTRRTGVQPGDPRFVAREGRERDALEAGANLAGARASGGGTGADDVTRRYRARAAEANAAVEASERGAAAMAREAREARALVEAERVGTAGSAAFEGARRAIVEAMEDEERARARLQLVTESLRMDEEAEVNALRARLAASGETEGAIQREADLLRSRLELQRQGLTIGAEEEAILRRINVARQRRDESEARAAANQLASRRIQDIRDETALIGLGGNALERRRLLQEMENEARQRGVTLSREDYQAALDRLRAAQSERALRQGDPVAGVRAGLQSVYSDLENFAGAMEKTTVSIFDGMTNALTEWALTGKANWRDFANTAIKELMRIAVQQAIIRPILGAVGGLFGGGMGGFGGTATEIAGVGAMKLHDGGLVGNASHASGFARAHPGLWRGAKRYHSGGMVGGLSAGERAIIAKDGEAVMPTVRLPDGTFGVRALGGGGSGSMVFAPTVTVNVQGGSSGGNRDNEAAIGEAAAKAVSAALDAKMYEFARMQQRPGGLFNRGGGI